MAERLRVEIDLRDAAGQFTALQFKCSHCNINLFADPELACRVVSCPG